MGMYSAFFFEYDRWHDDYSFARPFAILVAMVDRITLRVFSPARRKLS